jgi:hypothetical protein
VYFREPAIGLFYEGGDIGKLALSGIFRSILEIDGFHLPAGTWFAEIL